MRVSELEPVFENFQTREKRGPLGACGPLLDIGAGVAGVAQAAASVAGAGIQAGATRYAADKEYDAATNAANLESQASANSLAFEKTQWNTQQANEKPFLAAGTTAVNTLSSDLAPGGSLTQTYNTPFSFSGVDLTNDPSYQFDLSQGQQAIQRSAAATGGLVSGGALKDLDAYSQGYASNEYSNAYNRALTNYQTAYNVWSNNQNTTYNRLAAMAGVGQTSASNLGQEGSQAASTYANTAQTGAAGAANYLTQGASALGAGAVGVGNAINNGINGVTNAFNNYSSYQSNQKNYLAGQGSQLTSDFGNDIVDDFGDGM